MNAKQEFIERVKALKGTPQGVWRALMADAAAKAAAAVYKSGKAKGDYREGFETGATGATERAYFLRNRAYDRGIKAGESWVAQNPPPDPGEKLEIDLAHHSGVTRYKLERDDVAIDAFIKRLNRLPMRAFQ